MLKIRLTRLGKKKQPHYRFVVTEARSKRDSKFVATLGYYSPSSTPAQIKLDTKAYASWIEKGAQPSTTVRHLRAKVSSDKLTTFSSTRPKNIKNATKSSN